MLHGKLDDLRARQVTLERLDPVGFSNRNHELHDSDASPMRPDRHYLIADPRREYERGSSNASLAQPESSQCIENERDRSEYRMSCKYQNDRRQCSNGLANPEALLTQQIYIVRVAN